MSPRAKSKADMARVQRLVVIPARRQSHRLPDKLLLAESGRPLLAHTIERALQTSADQVLVAVDGPELAKVAEDAGAQSVLTDPALASGSDRVWAAVQGMETQPHVINLQGDEPEMDPAAVDSLFQALDQGAEVATLCAPWPTEVEPNDPAAVKVVFDAKLRALFFSRQAIPHEGPHWLHLGVYAYSWSSLSRFATTPPAPLERQERLEQLRFLELNIPIHLVQLSQAFAGIDTRKDYDAFLARITHPSSQS